MIRPAWATSVPAGTQASSTPRLRALRQGFVQSRRGPFSPVRVLGKTGMAARGNLGPSSRGALLGEVRLLRHRMDVAIASHQACRRYRIPER